MFNRKSKKSRFYHYENIIVVINDNIIINVIILITDFFSIFMQIVILPINFIDCK